MSANAFDLDTPFQEPLEVINREAIKYPETEELSRQSHALIVEAKQIKITNHDEFVYAIEKLKLNKALQKKIVEEFKPSKQAADHAHKVIRAFEKKQLDPLEISAGILNDKCTAWQLEQRRLQEAEAARLRKEAEEKAKAEAEEARKRHEQEQQRLKAEAEAESKRLKDEQAAIAAELEKHGFAEEAAQVMAEPIEAPVIAVAPPPIVQVPIVMPKPVNLPPKVQGAHIATTYSAQVTDLKRLIAEVAAGRQPIAYLIANQSALDGQARILKKEMNIPGVAVVENSSMKTRSK